MIHTKKDLQEKLDYLENNTARKWEIDRLQSQVRTLQYVLIEAGILVDAKGVSKTLIVVDGEPYHIKPKEK